MSLLVQNWLGSRQQQGLAPLLSEDNLQAQLGDNFFSLSEQARVQQTPEHCTGTKQCYWETEDRPASQRLC